MHNILDQIQTRISHRLQTCRRLTYLALLMPLSVSLAGCEVNSVTISTLSDSSNKESSLSTSSQASSQSEYTSQKPEEQKPTLTDFLRTALRPKDQVLYVWGGGWNEEDTAGGMEANTLGMAPGWKTFYEENLDGYIAEDHAYEIHNGLDCSGYLGWVLYNTLDDKRDYVVKSDQSDEFLSGLNLGQRREAKEVSEILPGDIMSEEGHVYIALGQFEDGSVLMVHSSPPGVRMAGTEGIAYETALLYQNNGWDPLADSSFLDYDQFRFSEEALPDPDHLREMTTAEVVDFLYDDPSMIFSESSLQPHE